MSEYIYIAAAQLNDGSETVIDLEERGWADKEVLDRTVRWTLIPKDGVTSMHGGPMPLVTVHIPEGARPVFKSRVYGVAAPNPHTELPELPDDKYPAGKVIVMTDERVMRSTGEDWEQVGVVPRFRCYGIGYKHGKKTHLVWVLPTGDIELTAEDTLYFADLLLRRLKAV